MVEVRRTEQRFSSFEVREATPADRPEIEALVAEMMPGCDVAARWRWLYEGNPSGRAITWVAIAPSGEVAGCTSLFPFRLWLDGAEILGSLGGDGYVRPAFRRRGLGGLLHDAARRGMPAHGLCCMYGAPGAMNVTPLKHGGSRELGHVGRYVRPIRVGPWLAGDVFARVTRPAFAPVLEPMIDEDPRVDAVWRQARTALRLASVRDATTYSWRFRRAPAQAERPFVIIRRGLPIGACALEALHGGAELHVVDLVAVPGAWHACLAAIVRHAVEHTFARTVSIKLFVLDARRRGMWRSGFVQRESKPFLCMIPKGGDRRFLDAQRWYYGGADSDLDALG